MVGNLSKLIPSLMEKKPSLNSLLPILSEFVHPTNNKNTNVDTTNAVPWKSSPAYDEQSLPTMVPRHHTKSNKPKMALPSTKTQTEPISLELFNHAAADLDKKGEIELECYKKYLFNCEWWRQLLNSPSLEWIWTSLYTSPQRDAQYQEASLLTLQLKNVYFFSII